MKPLQSIIGVTAGLEEFDTMKTRVIAAAVLLPLLLITVLALPQIITAVLAGVMMAIAAYELLYGTGLVRHTRMLIYSMVMAFLVALWSYFGARRSYALIGVTVFWVALFGEMMASHVKVSMDKVTMCLLAGLLIPYVFTSLVRIHNLYRGRFLILIPFVLAFLSDTGAYFAGRAFGRHKLAPVISPHKTVEGVVGGVIATMLGMVIYCFILQVAFDFRVNYGYALIYGLLGSLGGVFGDLSFSVIKRQTGIKDYGNLIPGHGGILDRFDSMMVVGPLTEALLLLIPVAVK